LGHCYDIPSRKSVPSLRSGGLDLPILAEGVETEAQRNFLAGESCDQIQGFVIGAARPIREYGGRLAIRSRKKNPPPLRRADQGRRSRS
jgi:predicted signal transduction protein with EAL and GGDEF domain